MSKNVRTQVRLPDDLHKDICKIAESDGVSMNAAIVLAVSKFAKKWKKERFNASQQAA